MCMVNLYLCVRLDDVVVGHPDEGAAVVVSVVTLDLELDGDSVPEQTSFFLSMPIAYSDSHPFLHDGTGSMIT